MANVSAPTVLIEDEVHKHFTDHKEPCRSCHLCEGGDHHWMAAATDDEEDTVMICKHCPVWRDISDADMDL